MLTKLSQLSFNRKKFYFMATEAPEAQKNAPAGSAEKAETVSEAFKKETQDTIEARLNKKDPKGVELSKDLNKLTKDLAEKALPKNEKFTDVDRQKYAEKLATAFDEGLSKIEFRFSDPESKQVVTGNVESPAFLDAMSTRSKNPATRVSIIDGNFVLLNAKNEPIDLNPSTPEVDEKISAIAALHIDTEPVAINVDLDKVAAEYGQRDAENSAAAHRKDYWNPETGIVHLTSAEQTKNEKLKTLFPTAKPGDTVLVTPKGGKPMEAKLADDGVWKYPNGLRAKIFDGYVLRPNFLLETKAEKPILPPLDAGFKFLKEEPLRLNAEQILSAEAGKLSWDAIAADLIKNNYNELGHLGYTATEYGKILAHYATDTGYYWIILPPKSERKVAVDATAKIEEAKKAANERTEAGKKKADAETETLYSKEKVNLWEKDAKYTLDERVAQLANDEKAWNEAWTKGFPMDSAAIMQAFKQEPFSKIDQTEIRDTMRNIIHYTGAENGVQFSYLFDAFNKPNHPLYKTLDGKIGTYKDMLADRKLIASAANKAQENRDNGKSSEYEMSDKEKQAWQQGTDKLAEIDQVAKSALLIIRAARIGKAASEEVKYQDVAAHVYSTEDAAVMEAQSKHTYNNEWLEANPRLQDILRYGGEEAWNKMWDKNIGNIQALKNVLGRKPFDKVDLPLYKERIFKALEASFGSEVHKMNMDDVMDDLNKEGEFFKNEKGEKGNFKEFQLELHYADIAKRGLAKEPLNADDLATYQQLDNPQKYAARYNELKELYRSSAYLFDAVANLDDQKHGAESIHSASTALDAIFPPSDTGTIGGQAQDYYQTYQEKGVTVNHGGFLNTGLFKLDQRDADTGISKIDAATSSASAREIILGKCRTNGDQIDEQKVQNEINRYIRAGIAGMIAEAASPERTANLKQLGLTEADLKTPDVVEKTAQKFNFDSNVGTLSQVQEELVRVGFLMELKGKGGEVAEKSEETITWSSDPTIREIQKMAVEKYGANNEDLKNIEQSVDAQMIAILHGTLGDNFSGLKDLGATIAIPLSKSEHPVYVAIDPTYNLQDHSVVFRFGAGTSTEIAKNLSLGAGVGIGTDGRALAGVGLTWEIPVDAKTVWEPKLTLGAFISQNLENGKTAFGAGAMLLWTRNLEKQYHEDVDKKLQASIYKAVEEAKDNPQKALALRSLPDPYGKTFVEIQYNLHLSDDQLVRLYEDHFKQIIEDQTRQAGLSEHKLLGDVPVLSILPIAVTAAGFGLGVIKDENGNVMPVPGVAFGLAIGSKLVVFQRPHQTTSQLSKNADASMNAKAEEKMKQDFEAAAKKGGYTVEYRSISEAIVGDAETGLRPIKSETSTTQIEGNKTQPDQVDAAFKEYQAALLDKGLRLTKVDNMYKLEVLNIGNMELYVDPAMQEKIGVFLKGGEIFISASANPKMVIKRVDNIYPRVKDGNIKETIITISDQDFRTQDAIKDESDFKLSTKTKDNTGAERTALSWENTRRHDTVSQFNLRQWDEKENKDYFDKTDKVSDADQAVREHSELDTRIQKAGEAMRSNVGEYSTEGVEMSNMHERAMQFMEAYPKEYRLLTTYKYQSEGDIKKLYDMILTANPDLGEKADPKTMTKVQVIMEELFNLSMAEAWTKYKGDVNNQEQKIAYMRQTVNSRCDWMEKSIYLPFFRASLTPENNPGHFTPEEIAHAYVNDIRNGQLAQASEIAAGTNIDVGVGTMNMIGERGFTVANSDSITDHKIYIAKDYSKALETGNPPMDSTIARVLRYSHEYMEQGVENQFLNSPVALKLALLGTKENNPMLAYAIGAENYEKLVACYSQKPAKMVEGSEAAVKSLQELVQKLRDAQTGIGSTRIMVDGKEYQSLVFNGIRFGIRTEALATGVYARCMNPSSIYDDSIIALRDEEKPTIVNNMAVYSARTTQTLATEYRNVPTAIGAVAAAPLKFKDNPPAPPGNPPKENQPQPHAGPGGQVGGGGGKEGGNVIANPRTINGIGTGGGGGTAGGSGGTSTGNSSDNGSGRGGELS